MLDFKKWLVRERQMSPESARVYQSRVKSMLNRLPETITVEDVSNYLNSEAYSQSRSAYRAFRTFVKEENVGIELPDYEAKKGNRPAREIPSTPVPVEVLDAIIELEKAGLSKKEARLSYWGHLVRVPESGFYEMPVYGQDHTWLQLPAEHVDVLRDYAKPPAGMEMVIPLIPAIPGKPAPANWRWIKQTLAIRKRTRQKS